MKQNQNVNTDWMAVAFRIVLVKSMEPSHDVHVHEHDDFASILISVFLIINSRVNS